MPKNTIYSIPALKRLPAYLGELRKLSRQGAERVSCPTLAAALHLDAIGVRKDLEMAGATGSPGVGFRISELIDRLETFLGWKNTTEAFLVGAGELGSALLGYRGFEQHGLRIVAAFDRDPVEAGRSIHGIPVFGMSCFTHYTMRLQIRIGILCVPDAEAQRAAEHMAEAGIMAIWNFTDQTLKLPEEIIRQRVNLAGDLAVLSVRLAEKLRGPAPSPAGEPLPDNKGKTHEAHH